MLGLSSHEPHFSLLREEVKFGKAAKRLATLVCIAKYIKALYTLYTVV